VSLDTASTVGAWSAYTAPFEVDGAGAHTVFYRATDAAGNVDQAASGRKSAKSSGSACGEGAFAPLGGSASPTPLVLFNGPVSGMSVPVELEQTIGVTEGLRSGPYTKTRTFTLSTTTP